jgi:hypothetical protein
MSCIPTYFDCAEEIRELFLSKFWSELRLTRRPTNVKFEIDISTFEKAKNWVLFFDPSASLIHPLPTTQFKNHITKTKIWKKSFLAAHYLESVLGKGFHCCDGGNQSAHLCIHTGVEGKAPLPLTFKLEFHEVASFSWLPDTQEVNHASFKIHSRFVFICSYTVKVSKIDGNNLPEVYAAASPRK